MIRLFLASTALCCVLTSAQSQQASPQMEVIDFLVDGPGLVGKTVTVTGCRFTAATTTSILCTAGMPGNFQISTAGLDKEDLRKALKTCTGFGEDPACLGSVTGTVAKGAFGLQIKGPKISWAK